MELACEKTTAILGGKKIIKDIIIKVKSKQFVGIIGPNGSGKSTLLKCIYRVLKPCSGAIYLDKKQLESYSIKESAKKMAVVSQHNSYNFEFTVKEFVLMGRSPHKRYMEFDNENDYKIVQEALQKLDMEEYSDRIFSTLSGGEKQRVVLARAFAQQTSFIVLDEPTNHLDIKHQLQMLSLLKNSEITIIAALHDLNIAAAYCDYIYVLKDGKIKSSGTPEYVFTKKLLKEIYEIDTTILTNNKTGRINILYDRL